MCREMAETQANAELMDEVLDYPQGTPLDVDPVLMELDQSPQSFVITVCTSFALAGFALSPLGHRWFGVYPWPLLAFTVLHAGLYAYGVFVLGARGLCGKRWKLRAFDFASTAAVAAAYGACSESPASPAYAVLIAAGLVFGQTAPGNRLMAAGLFVIPVAERAWLIPSPSPASLGVAAAAGAAAAAMYWTVSARSVRLLQLRTQVASTSALTDLAASREAQLKVAMSLHDGLSGALFAARRRAANAQGSEQVVQIGRSLLLRAYEAVHTYHGSAPHLASELESSLQGVARALGVPGTVIVSSSGRELPADEVEDVRDIALEAIANAARHEVASFDLRVELGQTDVLIECQTLRAANTDPGTGRGFRNTLLRAQSRGGDAKWAGSAERFVSTARWPAGEAFRAFSPVRLALEIAAAALFALTLGLINHSLPALLPPAVALSFGLYICFQAAARLKNAQSQLSSARAQRRSAEQTPVLQAVDSFLAAPLALLEQATTAADVGRVRSALAELAQALGDIMWALEWRPAPPMADEPQPAARDATTPDLLSLLSQRKAERSREVAAPASSSVLRRRSLAP